MRNLLRLEIDELETFENDLKGELTIVISEKMIKKLTRIK